MNSAVHKPGPGKNKKNAAPGSLTLSFTKEARGSRARKHDALLTFMANTRKVQRRPKPARPSFIRTILSLFL